MEFLRFALVQNRSKIVPNRTKTGPKSIPGPPRGTPGPPPEVPGRSRRPPGCPRAPPGDPRWGPGVPGLPPAPPRAPQNGPKIDEKRIFFVVFSHAFLSHVFHPLERFFLHFQRFLVISGPSVPLKTWLNHHSECIFHENHFFCFLKFSRFFSIFRRFLCFRVPFGTPRPPKCCPKWFQKWCRK